MEAMERNSALGHVELVNDPVEAPGDLLSARKALLNRIQPLTVVQDGRFLFDLVGQWAVILLAGGAAIWIGQWWAYVLAMVVIATRQHALGILLHDGTHYRLLSNRALNDAVCDYFCGLPVGMTTSRYRHEHLLHHRHLNTDRDPYWVDFQLDDTWHWPKRPLAALWVFVRDLTLLNSRRWGAVMHRWSPWINHFPSRRQRPGPPTLTPAERIRVYVFHGAVLLAAVLSGYGWQIALLWLAPLLTLTPAMVRLRTIGEHLAIPNRTELDASRHTDGSWFERQTVAPFNINYHLDHHLHPAVPYYNLPRLHALLLGEPHYTRSAICNSGYFGLGSDMLLGQIVSGADRAAESSGSSNRPS